MNIAPYQIQNVIRAYGQRVGRKGLVQLRPSASRSTPDVITISGEAKRRQITERITSEIISRLRGGEVPPQLSPKVVERLNKELGGRLDILPDQDRENGFKFLVIDADKGEVMRELSPQDTERLIKRMYAVLESTDIEGSARSDRS